MTEMKKGIVSNQNNAEEKPDTNGVSEPSLAYSYFPKVATQNFNSQLGFTYSKFQSIARKMPITLKEWSLILHLSERTLQLYAQNNTSFDGIYSDRLLQINDLLEIGLSAFVSSDAFYDWLKKDKVILGYSLNFSSLYSSQGIQLLIDEVGRIQMGVYI